MYWKSRVFCILVLWMVCVLADRILRRKKLKKEWKCFLPLLVYAVLVILSTVFSEHFLLSVKGMWEQYETVWVLLGYCVTAFYCYQVVESTEDARFLMLSLCIGAAIQGILGILQFCGTDFFNTLPGRLLITAGDGRELLEELSFSFEESSRHRVYMASYNPNYAGVYAVMVFPVLLLWGIQERSIWKRCLGILTGILMLFCLWGSGSKTGIFVAGILLAAVLAAVPDTKKKRLAAAGICAVAAVAAIVCYDFASGHVIANGVKSSFHRKENYKLSSIETGKDSVRICYRGKYLDLEPLHTEQGDTLIAVEEGAGELTVYWDMDGQCFRIKEKGYQGIVFDAYVENKTAHLYIVCNKIVWHFQKRPESKRFAYITQFGKEDQIVTAPCVWKGYERALTERGYIWGRTVPLLSSCLLWGSGPDTFIVKFPQDDYLMRANTSIRMLEEIPSKAHNQYLQTALQTGVASLVCLLIFCGVYLAGGARACRQGRENYRIQTGILLGVTGYLLMGLLNDSVVAVAPVFWGMIGVGMAMNLMVLHP